MEVSAEGIEFIKRHEAWRSRMYHDAGGKPTIGWGHLINVFSEADLLSKQLSKEEGEAILRKDLKAAVHAVNYYLKVPVTQNQFDALVSFTFNVGGGAFKSSALLKKLNAGAEEQEIVAEFKRWVFASGKKIDGLLTRRMAEVAFFLRGRYLGQNISSVPLCPNCCRPLQS